MSEPGREHHINPIPMPPPPKDMVEFVVEVFVVTVCTMLILSLTGLGILMIAQPERDLGPLISTITDIMNTIIGALIGFIAGRGHGTAVTQDKIIAGQQQAQAIAAAAAAKPRSRTAKVETEP